MCGSSSGSRSAESGTSQTPSRYPAETWSAARRATRVLPTPPGPTSVTSRLSRSSACTRRSSAVRPIKSLASEGSCSCRSVAFPMSM